MKDLTICLIESIQSTIAVFKNADVLVDDRKRIWFAILNLKGTLEPLKLKCMLRESNTKFEYMHSIGPCCFKIIWKLPMMVGFQSNLDWDCYNISKCKAGF